MSTDAAHGYDGLGIDPLTFDPDYPGMSAEEVAQAKEGRGGQEFAHLLSDGGSFIFDDGDDVEPVWGDEHRCLWAEGESLMLYSAPGVGKTTLAGLLIRARLGLLADVLGMPVKPGKGRVLYMAMDRPRQIARALRRQFAKEEREHLDEWLVIWKGPLPGDLVARPTLLLDMARAVGADTIVVDSVKDTGIRTSDDEGGAPRRRRSGDGMGCASRQQRSRELPRLRRVPCR